MTQNLEDSLTSEELNALCEVAKGPLATEFATEHAAKLMQLGLITKVRSEYFLTEAGKKQLASNR